MKHSNEIYRAKTELKRMITARETQRMRIRARLAARDAAYSASPCAPKVTVEVRGRRVVETRGQAVVGCKSADHIRHS